MCKDKLKMPQIAILMAVYEPRMDWLEAQLKSLDAQTYPNLRLYVRDDCSPTVPFETIAACVTDCIHSFSFEIRQNEKNLGSNETFERLTREAEGDYFAYCDQDDVWLPEKLTVLQETIEQEEMLLVCSDMFIIDENGRLTANSITKVRKHHKFMSGEGLAPKLLISNFVTGCTMLVDAKQAKEAVPFCPDMVHDHYLALCCAEAGKIASLPARLICYRIHTKNQTLMMRGVFDKQSYLDVRIRKLIRQLEWLRVRFNDHDVLSQEIERALEWAKAREANFISKGDSWRKIWQSRDFSRMTSLFEIVMAKAPNGLFMRFVELKRKNVV